MRFCPKKSLQGAPTSDKHMIYAVISDIHANAEALERVIEDAEKQGVEMFICLGDIVGYGPEPAKTMSLLAKTGAVSIAGNHDDAVAGRTAGDDFIDLARDAAARHAECIGANGCATLSNLQYTCTFGEAIGAHGDFTEPEEFHYIEDEQDAAANFEATDARIAFVGHTHVPAIFLTGRSGAVYKIDPQDFTIEDTKRYIVNPGSVGYPRERDGQCYSSYVVYDSRERSVTFRFIPFSVSSVMQRGTGPKRIKKRMLAVAAAAITAAAVFGTWVLVPKEEITVTEVVNVTNVIDDPELLLAEKTIPAGPRSRYFSRNLAIEKPANRAGAEVKTLFLDVNGDEISRDTFTVKSHSRAPVEIPKIVREKLCCIKISVHKHMRNDKISIKEFAPAVYETKPR